MGCAQNKANQQGWSLVDLQFEPNSQQRGPADGRLRISRLLSHDLIMHGAGRGQRSVAGFRSGRVAIETYVLLGLEGIFSFWRVVVIRGSAGQQRGLRSALLRR